MRRALAPPIATPWTLPVIDTGIWATRPTPARRWTCERWLARGTVGALFGPDGVGKSLLGQQFTTCVQTGSPFLGLPVAHSDAMYITFEDDALSLEERQGAINRALGLPANVTPTLSSLVGSEHYELFDMIDGQQVPSPLYRGIAARAVSIRAGLIVLDNISHMFGGNEVVKRDVVHFLRCCDQLALETDAAVLLLGHPAKAEGSEYSGNRGWSSHVRQRWFMDFADADSGDPDARVLVRPKANLSKRGETITFRWRDWAFVADAEIPIDQRASIAANAAASGANAAFLACLRKRLQGGDGRHVGPSPGPNYAPAQFEAMPQAKGYKRDQLKAAMERLFELDAIETATFKVPGKSREITVIRERAEPPELPPRTGPEHCPRTAPNSSPELPRAHTVYKYKGSGAPEAPAPHFSPDDLDWSDSSDADDDR
ncbi:AAA family ATPase [Sphingomonas qomolangmaensis]|uniref:AAA family ATPase n=1 Tax=Sphingomonas qomolangmaensis TaxID=2918765 RepID=A0ABY5L626_9SPHN|nr:AAA family ATPase [Sphingomonas qomolangmaensis]UUL82227.1 AAA family ATPase [Sphingomonas qomolangmaensis]